MAVRSLRGSGAATRITSMLDRYSTLGYDVDLFHYRFPHEYELPGSAVSKVRHYVSVPLGANRLHRHAALMPPLAWECLQAHRNLGRLGPYDVVQAETSNTWSAARTIRARKRLVDLHDDDSVRLRRLAKIASSRIRRLSAEISARKYSRWQRIVLAETDRTWFVSNLERDRLVTTVPESRTRVIPNGAADELWSVPPALDTVGQEVVFVAPGFYEANASGLAWFLREVWPLVKHRVPRGRLRVVGVGWDGFGSHRDVSFVGWRESLIEEYSRGRVVIAPLFAGGGTKLKVLEAMAAARPVVTTEAGAEGLPSSDGAPVCDDPRRFAAQVVRFLTDLTAVRMAGSSNRKAVEGFKWSAVWNRAARDLECLVGLE